MPQSPQTPAKPMTLNAFVHLSGPRLFKKQGPEAEVRAKLVRFDTAYKLGMVGPQGSDFPAVQTREAWVQSYEAWEALDVLAAGLSDAPTVS